ncbi:MAG: CDP-diacylglycerol--glycerol-3-phosphate 3-phosphatidyltransferase [Opitutia bacterium UBA7350]|nr:MAG: CDP-diacylglycerol--glycerol-3-phosphate 3-phosphatidyltransferase [Opitutae bacterium UBA7350]
MEYSVHFVLALNGQGLQPLDVNLPNFLTLLRVPLVFVIVGLLYLPVTWMATLAFICFIIGGITDWLDGYYARKQGNITDFGKLMDALTDKIFILSLMMTLLVMDLIPVFWGLPCLLLILTREFLITGLRLVATNAGVVLAADRSGKLKTVSQMLAVGLILFGRALDLDYSLELLGCSAAKLGLAFFVLSTLLTVYSGALYLKNYWGLFTGRKQ